MHSFTPVVLAAVLAAGSMACHKSQFTPEIVQRVQAAAARFWNGAIPLIPGFTTAPITGLFRYRCPSDCAGFNSASRRGIDCERPRRNRIRYTAAEAHADVRLVQCVGHRE